jgi:hypothetical protein
VQIAVFVFKLSSQPLNRDVVSPAALAILPDAVVVDVEHADDRDAGELCTLIGVDDLWLQMRETRY